MLEALSLASHYVPGQFIPSSREGDATVIHGRQEHELECERVEKKKNRNPRSTVSSYLQLQEVTTTMTYKTLTAEQNLVAPFSDNVVFVSGIVQGKPIVMVMVVTVVYWVVRPSPPLLVQCSIGWVSVL